MKNILYKLKYMAAVVACFAVCMTSACNEEENGNGNSSSEPIVGRWHCDYGLALRAVFFLDKDGTFIFVSLYNFYNAINGTYSLMPMHYRGKYQVRGGKIEATELWRYQNGLNPNGSAAAAAEIVRIIEKGTRNEVMALLNPRHAYYQVNNNDWVDVDDRSGDLEFSDANKKMTTNLFIANNTYVRK